MEFDWNDQFGCLDEMCLSVKHTFISRVFVSSSSQRSYQPVEILSV